MLSASVSAQGGLQVGVVVEAVARNGSADRAGLREGDLIRKWERGGAQGVIDSPFDLTEIETEQDSLGSVTLEGERDGADPVHSTGPPFAPPTGDVGNSLPERTASPDRTGDQGMLTF